MANPKQARCRVNDIRCEVQARLKLPAARGGYETPTGFWERLERMGRLTEALALYDQLAAEIEARARVPRETKEEFTGRIEREGRRAEAEEALAELLASGLSRREAQQELVARFQPLGGGEARAWHTPDPWEAGRLFRRKADQDSLLAKASYHKTAADAEREKASEIIRWAKLRRDEGRALAEARRRARTLTASVAATGAAAPSTIGV